MATDLELLDAWRGGDCEAGSALFERYFESLCRFFRNKVDANVEDLIQTTFLHCVEQRPRFRDGSSFRAFLFRVARNRLYDHYQRLQREPVDTGVTSAHDLHPSPSLVAARLQEHRLVIEALRRIPIDLQIVLELYYWEGLRGRELAAVLEIPEGTVRSRVRRGQELVRRLVTQLAKDGGQVPEKTTQLDEWASSVRRELAHHDAGSNPLESPPDGSD